MHAVDTNVLIYAFDAHEKEKQQTAKRILKEAFDGEKQLHLTNQILAEFVSAATTKLSPPLSAQEAARFVRSVQASENWTLHNYTTTEVVSAAQKGKHFWDSLIAATLPPDAKLLTENTKHFAHTDLQSENPFA